MRFNGLVLALSAAVLVACGGGESETAATDTAVGAGAATTPTTTQTTPATGTATAAPATGTKHTVNMVITPAGTYEFQPKDITIKAGDEIEWIMVSGGPHNVAFDPAQVPANAKAQLSANMPNQMSELAGPILVNPNETYKISFAGVPAGKYDYVCTPHLAMGMVGSITITP